MASKSSRGSAAGAATDDVLEEIADRLYEGEPSDFVAGRDAAVAEAKVAGDAKRAAAIGKLRKPTVGAWVVNRLALRQPDLITDLLDLGESLREAQRRLKGDELRKLAGQRRAVIASLVGEAQKLSGVAAAKLPLTEIEATLTAALSDDDIATQVRSGRLLKTVSYTGFGEMPDAGAEPEPPARKKPKASDDTDPAEAERERKREAEARRAREELEAAQAAEAEARDDLERAQAAEQEAAELLEDLERQIEELEQRRADARKDLNQRRTEHKSAQRALTTASRRVTQAEAALL